MPVTSRTAQAPLRREMFETESPEELEDHYERWYGRNAVSVRPNGERFYLKQTRLHAGNLTLDTSEGRMHKLQHFEPLGMIVVGCGTSGGMAKVRRPHALEAVYRPGDVFLLADPAEQCRSLVMSMSADGACLDLDYVRRVAGSERMQTNGRSFLGYEPRDRAGAEHWLRTYKYVRDELLSNEEAGTNELLLDAAAHMLAASVVAIFPNVLHPESGRSDRHDSAPASLRRAIGYIESNITKDLPLADIAHAARISPRAVQLAFRRHMQCTPNEYIRRLRLAGAREDLLAAGPEQQVGAIAMKWGFGNASRFARYYREEYGELPSATLQH